MSDNFFKIRNGINLGNLSADPANPNNGDMYYNTTTGSIRIYTGGAWSNAGVPTTTTATPSQYIANGNAELGTTTGWATYNETQTATFTNASANIGLSSVTGLYIGMPVNFTTSSALPTNFIANTIYFITSIVSLNIQVSATKNGTAITAGSAGTGTQVFRPIIPITANGGSATSTWTTSSSNPLHGNYSFLYTKSAANLSGEGVSYGFTIDNGDQTKVMQISFDYIVSSGTFVAGGSGIDSDLEIYLVDVTNGTVIQPTTYKLFSNSSNVTNSFIGNFQTASNSISYRLVINVATTSTTSYILKFDNISVTPTQYYYNTIITDWQNFPNTNIGAAGSTTTLLTVNTGTAPTYGTLSANIARWRRVGSDMEIDWIADKTSGGTAQSSSSVVLLNLPPGYSIDTTKTNTNGSADNKIAGVGSFAETFASGGTRYGTQGIAHVWNSTQLYFDYIEAQSSNASSSGTFNAADFFFSSGYLPVGLHVHVTVPIQGWSVQQQTSDINDQRIVVADYAMTTNTSVTGNVTINWDTKIVDTHSAMSAGVFTAPVPGVYGVTSQVCPSGSAGHNMVLWKNGARYRFITCIEGNANSNSGNPGITFVSLNAGDTIDIRLTSAATLVGQNGESGATATNSNFVSIFKVANPAQISSTETVAFTANNSGAISGTLTTLTANWSVVLDTHGVFNTSTGTWTAPIAGVYEVTSSVGSGATNATCINTILYNSVEVRRGLSYSAAVGSGVATTSYIVKAKAGDTFNIQALSTGSGNYTVAETWMQVKKLGI